MKGNQMKVSLILLCLVSSVSFAETKIYQTDSIGNVQYQRGTLVVQNGMIVKQDSIGNTQSHLGGYKIVNNQIYKTDSIGNVQYHKGSMKGGK